MRRLFFVVIVGLLFVRTGWHIDGEAQQYRQIEHRTFRQTPFEIAGTTLVPLREIAEAFRLYIVIDDTAETVTVTDRERTATFTAGSQEALKIGQHLFVPLRALTSAFEWTVEKREQTFTTSYVQWSFSSDKRIVIDKATQHLLVFEGLDLIYHTRTVTGGRGFRTPSGSFMIKKKWRGWHEVKGKRWRGWMYNAMYFNAPGDYAIHGSKNMPYHPDSHGCCRVSIRKQKDGISPADWLFPWTPIGTPVYIVDSL